MRPPASNGRRLQYLARLMEGETQRRHERQILRRVAAARFPVIKTLEQFNWTWPKKVNQAQVQNLFRLAFLKDQASVVFIRRRRPGQNPSGDRAGPRGVPPGPRRALYHRHRSHQHPEHRPGSMPA